MAKFDVTGLEDLVNQISSIDADRIAPMMLTEASPYLEKNIKSRAAMHNATGSMIASIKPSTVDHDSKGYHICVRPTGKDKKGVRNMEKMVYLEYGTSKQAASPVLSPAVRESESTVISKMEEVFEREISK